MDLFLVEPNWDLANLENTGGRGKRHPGSKGGGFSAEESIDGKSLYLWLGEARFGECRSRVAPLSGFLRVCGILRGGELRLAVFILSMRQPRLHWSSFFFATQRGKAITSVDLGYGDPESPSFDISTDGQWILFTRVDQSESDITLVENFR
ncbi:MAG: hypothetical protein AUI85_03110 [Acidobacteriales bacterium 13_1_40CM_3_55_5]|nr:MAG: hypothetical protein AUI85_03110 [Acidobacteriales bacterium 13_1_40CM_3_55_5]